MFKRVISVLVLMLVVYSSTSYSQYYGVNLDTVKSSKYDMGKMWTFDFPPVDYFNETYGFKPTQEWLDHVRMSAIRFATYCSSSFVSGDGLVMTNHHCGRESVSQVEKEGEDLHKEGFSAMKIEDERKVPGLFVDQLIKIIDVTKEMQTAIDQGKDIEEKDDFAFKKTTEIENRYKEGTSVVCQVVTLYNGGVYSAYVYKRYNDVRLVFAPEDNAGFFGGDPDNFTYPRYNLDCTFFRVYDDNGKPLKSDHYFKWSTNGAMTGEPVFVVGNPGTTNRLYTVSMLESQRDYTTPVTIGFLKSLVNSYSKYLELKPEKAFEMNDQLFSFANGLKATNGQLEGLMNPVFMKKKQDWEAKFKAAVMADPKLASEYGHLWDKIAEGRKKMHEVFNELNAFRVRPMIFSQYFLTASGIVGAAKKGNKPDLTVFPDDFDQTMSELLLKENITFISGLIGTNHPAFQALTGGRTGDAAVKYLLEKSSLTSKEKVEKFLEMSVEDILKSDDPFIKYSILAQEKVKSHSDIVKKSQTEEAVYLEKLGRAVFEVYGTTIPPDATFSLRISDGVVKGYDYNGTTAPSMTTFYGLYDRYFSHGKKFPWSLPEKWENPPAEFDLSVPFNFVSTNDIIGGNSGSPVINQKAEIVGLAFDGNIESLPGQFIFDETANRTVSVHSAGMYEAIKNLYKATRLANELKNGRLD